MGSIQAGCFMAFDQHNAIHVPHHGRECKLQISFDILLKRWCESPGLQLRSESCRGPVPHYTNGKRRSRIFAVLRCPHPLFFWIYSELVSAQFLCGFKRTNKSIAERAVLLKAVFPNQCHSSFLTPTNNLCRKLLLVYPERWN